MASQGNLSSTANWSVSLIQIVGYIVLAGHPFHTDAVDTSVYVKQNPTEANASLLHVLLCYCASVLLHVLLWVNMASDVLPWLYVQKLLSSNLQLDSDIFGML